jgi:hypothetical protein
VNLRQTAYKDAPGPFFEELLRRTSEWPDVRAASLANLSVLSGSMSSVTIQVPDRKVTNISKISAGYFRTLGIPLLAGREIGTDENEVMNGDALDKVFRYGSGRQARIVGIAGTARYRTIREDPQLVMYLPVA